jgi:hypothetical protein
MITQLNVVLLESEHIEDLDGLTVVTGETAIIERPAERTETLLPSWPEIFESDGNES